MEAGRGDTEECDFTVETKGAETSEQFPGVTVSVEGDKKYSVHGYSIQYILIYLQSQVF